MVKNSARQTLVASSRIRFLYGVTCRPLGLPDRSCPRGGATRRRCCDSSFQV